MGDKAYSLFKFSCGGYFSGWNEFKIDVDGDTYTASLVDKLAGQTEFAREITESELTAFERCLQDAGVQDWFCHYNNWMVLDGTQWEMEYEGMPYSGSNSYPSGFFQLVDYLADHFDCECFRFEDDLEEESEDQDTEQPELWDPYLNPLSHIAEYAHLVRDPETDTIEDDEEELAEYGVVAKQMRHDFDVLVGIEPKFKNYMEIVDEGGAPKGSEAMRECDPGSFDADTLVAMMIYIYREDRFCGYQEHFRDYVKDGTFKRWLDRLSCLVKMD